MLPKNIESVALTARWGWDCLAILLQHRASRVDCENLPDGGAYSGGRAPQDWLPTAFFHCDAPARQGTFPDLSP
jgi:hypothetical protein